MTEFKRIVPDKRISIDSIITMHFFEYNSEFVFEGELHDFWEMVYVYKGKVEILADKDKITLKEGEIIFHKPDEFHGINTSGKGPSKVVVISFDASGSDMPFFSGKRYKLNMHSLDILNELISIGDEAFNIVHSSIQYSPLMNIKDSYCKSYQLLANTLELFLLSFIHGGYHDGAEDELNNVPSIVSRKNLAKKVVTHLKEKIYSNISIDDVCETFKVSKSYLSSVFKQYTGKSVINYYNELKIEKSKEMILAEEFNITEISEKLGFSSVHYFSRMFKNYTGMSPMRYEETTHEKRITDLR